MTLIIDKKVEFDLGQIISLEKEVVNLNQTIGAQRETIHTLEEKNLELRAQHAKELLDAKKRVIITTRREYEGPFGPTIKEVRDVKYENLDDVVETIKKEESKKLKIDNSKLENELEDLKLSKEKTDKELTRLQKHFEDRITEAKSDVRERYNKILEGSQKEIETLKEELQKVKDNKTDSEIEEARKQEIITLKERIHELETELSAASSINLFRKTWNKLTNNLARKQALKELEEKKERIEKISRNYPKSLKFWGAVRNFFDDFTYTF